MGFITERFGPWPNWTQMGPGPIWTQGSSGPRLLGRAHLALALAYFPFGTNSKIVYATCVYSCAMSMPIGCAGWGVAPTFLQDLVAVGGGGGWCKMKRWVGVQGNVGVEGFHIVFSGSRPGAGRRQVYTCVHHPLQNKRHTLSVHLSIGALGDSRVRPHMGARRQPPN